MTLPVVRPSSKSMKKIETAVHGKNTNNLKDLPHLQHFIHTHRYELPCRLSMCLLAALSSSRSLVVGCSIRWSVGRSKAFVKK